MKVITATLLGTALVGLNMLAVAAQSDPEIYATALDLIAQLL